jgi:hypothetical protein
VVGVPGSGCGRVEVVGEVVVGKRVVGERVVGDVVDAGVWSSGGLRWSRGWWSTRAGGGRGGRVERVVSVWCACGGRGRRGGRVVMVGRWSAGGSCAS